MIKIDNSPIQPHDILLAPMAEISHGGFRRLCDEFGGYDWYFTEMLSAAGVVSTSRYTSWYFDFGPYPKKTFVQLAGNNPDLFYRAAEKILTADIAGIDINMGCSVHHIRSRGWGVELMNRPETALEIVQLLKPLTDSRPLSVKLRIGKEENPDELLRFCNTLVEAGVAFITLNPRTSKTNRNRPGDWKYVDLLRRELPVPVIGNGEIVGRTSYLSRQESAGEGPVMIGRGAVQKPWIAAALKKPESKPEANLQPATGYGPSMLTEDGQVDLQAVIERFLDLLETHQPEDFHVSRGRRFFLFL
ncbi:MAG: tRNA-dihydrouridine synthase family protein [Spirochaetia bacterium]|nr:tRNA-dihydrouridine synthase family protein [Spirochaetia bacterium]